MIVSEISMEHSKRHIFLGKNDRKIQLNDKKFQIFRRNLLIEHHFRNTYNEIKKNPKKQKLQKNPEFSKNSKNIKKPKKLKK
jgi:hypothetical protein